MARQSNQVRIIGGEHRGRRLSFPDGRGLRPTADRVRETLFNWLQSELHGAHVLDLFAGSGALGFEALSRGAASVCFVERARPAAQKLHENIALLKVAPRAEVKQMDARRLLAAAPPEQPFDIVLLDPPFADRLLPQVCQALIDGAWLAADAWVYLEQDAAHDWPGLAENWHLHRDGRAGQSVYRLVRVGEGASE